MVSHTVTVARTQAKIDDEIAALEERIRALRYERNGLAPISRLPPEVMSQIFMTLQQKYLGDLYSNQDIPQDYPKWTRVTRVSQHWRQIALSSNILWNIIPITNRHYVYAAESFNRLGSASFFLIVDLVYHGGDKQALWELMAQECHRIQFIRGSGIGRDLANFIEPMPLLQYVEIIATDYCKVPSSIFSPSLRIIGLSRGDFAWNWPALPYLTTIYIRDPKETVSYDSLVNILAGSPHLKVVILENVFPPTTEPNNSELAPLLPTLSRFRCLHSPLSLDLFSRLRFTAGFNIDIGISGAPPVSLLAALRLFNPLVEGYALSLRHVGITSRNDGGWVNSVHLRAEVDRPLIRISFTRWDQTNWGRFLKDFAIHYLAEAESLSIDVIKDAIIWKQSGLGQLSTLRLLDVGTGGNIFFKYFAQDYEEFKESRGRRKLAFTAVEEVQMTGLQFGRELKQPVCDALAGREKAGYRFKKMIIKGGYVTEDSKKQIRKYVDVIEFW